MRRLKDYTNQLIASLPTGWLWEQLSIANLFKPLLKFIAVELLRVEDTVNNLVNELMPDKTRALAPRWESVLDLPDSCTGVLPTLQQRVAAIVGKLFLLGVERGSLSKQFYIDLAERHGYTITITILSANNWQVNAAAQTITYFRAGVSSAGDPLQSSSNDLLECVINKYKSAHTAVTFSYT